MTTAALRLAIYLPNFHGGGVERISLMLIDAFIARGVDVSVVVHRPSGDLHSLLPPTVRLVSLDIDRSLAALPRLAGYLRRESPDVLLSNLGHNNIVALWARMLLRLGSRCTTRVVICQHNALSAEAQAMGNWQHRVLPLLYRWFGGQADAIVGVSHGVSDDMARATGIPREHITTIHNPVLDARFEPALAQASSHRWLRDPALKVIIGIGRLVPQKDFPTLVAAFAQLDRADTRLIILGDGAERERLQQLARDLGVADRVDLAGFAINPLPSLRDARVMVMSSIYEGFGNVLVEALGAGVPVVATRCPYGPDEILDGGHYGELVPVGDAAAMADAIDRQLDAPRPSRALRQARARDFHVDIVAEHYLALFESPRRGAERAPAAVSSAFLSAGLSTGVSAGPSPGLSRGLSRGLFVFLPNLHMGGGELSLVRLAAGFAAQGVPVTLVIHDDRIREIEVPPQVELVCLGARRSLLALTHLKRLLQQRRPAVLLTAFPHSNVVAVMARWLSGVDCRLVISEHAPMTEHYVRMGGWRYRCLPPFVRWAYPRADAIVAVSEGVRDDLMAMLSGISPQVIHNPILPLDWAARAAEPSGHPWLEDRSLAVVLSVSRLAAEKDIPTLVEAFAGVAATRPAVRLLIAGEGPERAAIERCIERFGLGHQTQLTGTIHNPLAWMRQARVFVLASQYEGFGNVLIEALAAGTRVISTDCPVGPREVLQGGRLGALVPVGDAGAMSAAMAVALDDALDEPLDDEPEAASAQRLHARHQARDVAQRYTQERACSAYLSLFAAIEARAPIAAS